MKIFIIVLATEDLYEYIIFSKVGPFPPRIKEGAGDSSC